MENMFPIRLTELRNEKVHTAKDMAKLMNISEALYQSWEDGKADPDFAQLISLAGYFAVSCNYIVGLTEKRVFKQNIFSAEEIVVLSKILNQVIFATKQK